MKKRDFEAKNPENPEMTKNDQFWPRVTTRDPRGTIPKNHIAG